MKSGPGTGEPSTIPQGSPLIQDREVLRGTWDPERSPALRLGKGFITADAGRVGAWVRERGGWKGTVDLLPLRAGYTTGKHPPPTPRPLPQTPAERLLGSGFSFRGVQPVTSRRSLTARGSPLTVKAVGLAGVFLSY